MALSINDLDLSQPGTQEQLALLLDCSQPAVHDLIRRGVVRPGASLLEQLHQAINALRAAASDRVGDPELQRERTRMMAARRELAEMELRQRHGELVVGRDYASATITICQNFTGGLRDLAPRVGPLLAAEADPAKCTLMLAAEIDAALRQLYVDLAKLKRPGS